MSDLVDKILAIMQDGEFHSGSDLGAILGVSRTAVWKQLQKLEAMGLEFDSVKGTGYRLPQGFELLSQPDIESRLSVRPSRLEIFQSLDSTNKYLREQAELDSQSGSVVFAETQTSGRGRRGKTWVSPFASNIYLSILWDFEQGAQALEGLSLGVGVAVRRALIESGLPDVQLKWPNDIYIGGKKLGGILLEMVGDPVGHCSVIIGVGINVSMPRHAAESIDQAWTDVATEADNVISRNQLAAYLVDNIFTLLTDFQSLGFAPYRDEWQAADAFKGLMATLSTPREAITGTILGVDETGALEMIMDNGDVQRFIGGELSLRLKQ